MLILLGAFRLYQYFQHSHDIDELMDERKNHHLAYGVGLVHGLAGSGAMVLLVMTEIEGSFNSILYLLIFGFGSVIGMLIAAGALGLPFSKKIMTHKVLQIVLILLSSGLCIGYGAYVMYENLA